MFCMCTRSCARANDVKIVCSRDVQCSAKELPQVATMAIASGKGK